MARCLNCGHREEVTFYEAMVGLAAWIITLSCTYLVVQWAFDPPNFLKALGCKPVSMTMRMVTDGRSDKLQPNQLINTENQVRNSSGIKTIRQNMATGQDDPTEVGFCDFDQAIVGRTENEPIRLSKSVMPPSEKLTPQPVNTTQDLLQKWSHYRPLANDRLTKPQPVIGGGVN